MGLFKKKKDKGSKEDEFNTRASVSENTSKSRDAFNTRASVSEGVPKNISVSFNAKKTSKAVTSAEPDMSGFLSTGTTSKPRSASLNKSATDSSPLKSAVAKLSENEKSPSTAKPVVQPQAEIKPIQQAATVQAAPPTKPVTENQSSAEQQQPISKPKQEESKTTPAHTASTATMSANDQAQLQQQIAQRQSRAKKRTMSFFNVNEMNELIASPVKKKTAAQFNNEPDTPVEEYAKITKTVDTVGGVPTSIFQAFPQEIFVAFRELKSLARDLNSQLPPPEFVFIGKRGQGKSALIEAILGTLILHVGSDPNTCVTFGSTLRPIYIHVVSNPTVTGAEPKYQLRYFSNESNTEVQQTFPTYSALSLAVEKLHTHLSDKPLHIQIEHAHYLDFVIIDAPGLIVPDSLSPEFGDKYVEEDPAEQERQRQLANQITLDLIFPGHRKIVAVEEAGEWNDLHCLNFVKGVDPTLTRTLLALTKFHSHLKSLTSDQLHRFFTFSPHSTHYFLTSLFSSKVRSKHCPTADEFIQKVAQACMRDKRILETLNFDSRYRKTIGVFQMRHYMLKQIWREYQNAVPELINRIRTTLRQTDAKLQKLQDHPLATKQKEEEEEDDDSMEVDRAQEQAKVEEQNRRLRTIASAYVTNLLRTAGDLIAGTIEGVPGELGETLAEEVETGGLGPWLDDNYAEIKPDEQKHSILHVNEKLYGGHQFKRLLSEFKSICMTQELPNMTLDEIAITSGASISSDSLNLNSVVWAASEVSQQRLGNCFKSALEHLIKRSQYILKRILVISERIMKERNTMRKMWLGSNRRAKTTDDEDFNRYPLFVSRVKHLFDEFVEKIAKQAREKCLDDFLETRTIFWGALFDPAVKEGIEPTAFVDKPEETAQLVTKRVFNSVRDRLADNVSMKLFNFLLVPMKDEKIWAELHGKVSSWDDNELRQVFEIEQVGKAISAEISQLHALFNKCMEQESIFLRNSTIFNQRRTNKTESSATLNRIKERRFKYELHGLEGEKWNTSTTSRTKAARGVQMKVKSVSFGAYETDHDTPSISTHNHKVEETLPVKKTLMFEESQKPKQVARFTEEKLVATTAKELDGASTVKHKEPEEMRTQPSGDVPQEIPQGNKVETEQVTTVSPPSPIEQPKSTAVTSIESEINSEHVAVDLPRPTEDVESDDEDDEDDIVSDPEEISPDSPDKISTAAGESVVEEATAAPQSASLSDPVTELNIVQDVPVTESVEIMSPSEQQQDAEPANEDGSEDDGEDDYFNPKLDEYIDMMNEDDPSLAELDLNGVDEKLSKLGDVQIQDFAEALGSTLAVKTAKLGNKGIDNSVAIIIIMYLKKNKSLRILDLSDNPRMDDGCAQACAQMLRSNTILATLNLSGTSITDKGWNTIKEALEDNMTLKELVTNDRISPSTQSAIEKLLAKNQ